jgi:hypothetical protein
VKKYPGIVTAACIGLLSMILTSCPEVMSTSWGRWAKRAPKIPPITADNIESLLDATVGDPEFAEALLEAIREEIPNKDGEEKARLQGAAVTAAANGSGLDMEVITHIGDLIDAATGKDGNGPGVDNIDKITEIFDEIFNNTDHGTIHDLAEDLSEVLLVNGEDESIYDSTKYWKKPSVTTDSLLLATVTLLIAETDNLGIDSFDEYLDWFQEKRADGVGLTDNERAILILVKQLAKRNSDTFGALLEGLKLDDII